MQFILLTLTSCLLYTSHPGAFELIGEARKMASKVNFKVKCVIAGGAGTIENAHKLLDYGVDQVLSLIHIYGKEKIRI